MSFNTRIYSKDWMENFVEIMYPYYRNDFVILVPKSGQRSNFYNLFRIYTEAVWISLILAIILMILVLKLFQWVSSTWSQSCIIIFQSFIGDAINTAKNNNRLIIGSWILYSFFITHTFTGKLVSRLVEPLYRDDLTTIQELQESGMTVIAHERFPDIFKAYVEKEFYQQVIPMLTLVNDSQFFNYLYSNKSKTALVTVIFMADFYIHNTYDKLNGRPTFNKIKDPLTEIPKVYIIKQGSQFLGRINSLITRCIEAGLYQYWDFNSVTSLTNEGQVFDEAVSDDWDDEEEIKIVLTIEHLQSAFYLWSFGIFLGFIAFCMELLWFRCYSAVGSIVGLV